MTTDLDRLIELLDRPPASLSVAEVTELAALREKFPEQDRTHRALRAIYPVSDHEPPAELVATARGIDRMNTTTPLDTKPARRFRWWMAAAPAGLAAGLLITLCAVEWVNRNGKPLAAEEVPPARPWPKPLSAGQSAGDFLTQVQGPKEVGASFLTQKVSTDQTIGSGEGSAVRREFGKLVGDLGKLTPKVRIDGQDYDLPPPDNPVLVPQRVTGYKLSGNQFETYEAESKVLARGVEETLFTVNDLNVFPAVVINMRKYLRTGEVERPNVGPGVWAPQKLTAYGPPLKPGEKGENVSKQPWTLTSPADRKEYDTVRSAMIPQLETVGAWSEITETAQGTGHLNFKLSIQASGMWGKVKTDVQSTDDEEKGSVFMLLTQESYRVAVDARPLASGWVNENLSAEDLTALRAIDYPLGYISEVTYGRVVLAVATSSLTSSEVKMALNGETSFLGTSVSVDAQRQKKESLKATSIKVLNWGGSAMPDKAYTFDEFRDQLTALKKAPLEPKNAMPIAFKVNWLADGSTAGWLGITPLRTYRVTPQPITFDLILDKYKVKDDHDGFPRGDGELMIAAKHESEPGDVKDHCFNKDYKLSLGDRDEPYDLTYLLYSKHAIFGTKFTLYIRQGEEDDGLNSWDEFDGKDGYYQDTLEVDVQAILDQKDGEDKPVRTKQYHKKLPDGNELWFTIRINAPEGVMDKYKEPPLKSPTQQYEKPDSTAKK